METLSNNGGRLSLLVHAPNIHQGGGRTLLVALLRALATNRSARNSMLVLDERLKLDDSLAERLNVVRIPATPMGRLRAEWKLSRAARNTDLILCLGNLPPLLPVKAKVILFLQNYYLVQRKLPVGIPARLRIRLSLERIWLRRGLHRCHSVVVQSQSMQRQVRSNLGTNATIAPFVEIPPQSLGPDCEEKIIDYLYVASGAPHKNHRTLVRAWTHLGGEGLYPCLGLTLDSSDCNGLTRWIKNEVAANNLRIKLLGNLLEAQLEKTYLCSRALIFPSLFESFGLPLLEAEAYGLPILASERDYVRDVISPKATFDPESPISIARAVKRHMGLPQQKPSVISAHAFLEKLQRSLV